MTIPNLHETTRPRHRYYPPEVTNRLYALTAGRCEFRGCNTFTMRHEVTGEDGNFAIRAHIYAFSERGPRPARPEDGIDLNAIENLMLLCLACSKRIDDDEERYPVELLREFKKEHEDRVHLITGLDPAHRTKPLVFLANIAKDPVTFTDNDMFTALFPNRYPTTRVDALDFSAFADRNSWYGDAGRSSMDEHLARFYREPGATRPSHVSVFALGPMALLMQLGASLTNKVPTDFYQKHRPSGAWKWSEDEGVAKYTVTTVQKGAAAEKVALILSLSGRIHTEKLGIAEDYTIYEIVTETEDGIPNPMFLKTRADLEKFRKTYVELISRIIQEHPGVKEIHVYPAVPAPVAVACGFDLLPKAHPDLVVYDVDKNTGGFTKVLTVTRQENV